VAAGNLWRVFNAATTNEKAADGCGCRRALERSTERERDRVVLVAEINWRRLGDRRNSWARPGLLHAITDSFDLSLLFSLSLSRSLSLFLPVRSLASVSISVHRRRSSEARSNAPLLLGVRFCALSLSLSLSLSPPSPSPLRPPPFLPLSRSHGGPFLRPLLIGRCSLCPTGNALPGF